MNNVNLQDFIAKRIKILRKQQRLSQEKLSEKAGLGINYVHKAENNTYNIKLGTLEKILEGLETTPELFFDFEASDSDYKLKSLMLRLNSLDEHKKERFLSALELLLKNME